MQNVNEKLKTNFKGEGFETFGGFIISKAGRIPKEKDEIDINNKYKAVIEEIANRRVMSVKLVGK